MKINRYLVVSILSLLLSASFFLLVPFVPTILTNRLAKPPALSQAKDVIKERTNLGIDILKTLINESIEHNTSKAFGLLSQSVKKQLDEEGLAVFIFQEDQLKVWSDNIDVEHVIEYSDRLVLIQNTWCISYWIARDDFKGLLLVKLKYNYPHQNQFLENKFHSSLSFLEGYMVSAISYPGSFPLTVFSSQPVFYLSYIPKDFDAQKESFVAIITRAGFIFLLLAIFSLFWWPGIRRGGVLSKLLLLLLVGGLRVVTLHFQLFPQGNWRLFGPEIFAYSWLTPSLGDFLLNSILLFILVCYFFKVSCELTLKNDKQRLLLALVLGLISFSTFFVLDKLISILVQNSTVSLEVYRIFSLSIYSALEYLSISFWFVSAIILMKCSFRILPSHQLKHIVGFIALVFLISLVTFSLSWSFPSIMGVVLVLLVAFLFGFFSSKYEEVKSNNFFLVTLLISVYSVVLVSNYAEEKEQEIRKILAINLANERDPVAEVMFPQIARKMYSDEDIVYFLDNIFHEERELNAHIYDNYLSSYFNKYDFQITVCFSTSNLTIEKTGEVIGCYDFFENLLNQYGLRIPGTSFYHLNNQNGRISYLGMIEYVLPDGEEISIYLELDSKLSRELLGYPELLLDGDLSGRSNNYNYSSAKYYENNLIARTGEYNYPLINHLQPDTTLSYTFVLEGDHSHMIYQNGGDITLLLSRPQVNMFNITASFAWVFLFFFLTLLILFRLAGLPVSLNLSIPSFKNRIRFSMVQVLILSLIMVGMVTIAFSVKSFETKNTDSLNEKLLSVLVDVEGNLVRQDLLRRDYQDYLTNYLISLSNVFHSDINIYDTTGKLIATSRPEVFDRQLFGQRMHPLAWYQMVERHQAKLIHTEQIGSMEFLSAYAPLTNSLNQTVAYLNLPYFTRQGEFMQEILSVIVALVNIYALLILFTVFVAVVISNRISKPLELIREKLATVDITKHNETISYEGKDEVGQLVNEYNRMVLELAESARKIAQSQRQSAWREMAKQIAHEIKNPLTPIKLNLQHLVRAKKENMQGWHEMFDRFADSLIDQINALSNIATEFSNFAKMPTGNFTNVSLGKVINDAVILFSSYPNVTISVNFPSDGEVYVFADKEQLQRVFVNLLKNAIQAIGRKIDGKVDISLDLNNEYARVCVKDNGGGIHPEVKERLFSPNFTTKSGGMGLGLAISRGIVEVVGGKIWFETNFGVGTEFYVELPLVPIHEKDV